MGELRNLPRPPLPPDKGVWSITEKRMLVRCERKIHIFSELYLPCQCGENTWPPNEAANDMAAGVTFTFGAGLSPTGRAES